MARIVARGRDPGKPGASLDSGPMTQHRLTGVPVHRFPLIDVVRGFAALSIALFHTYSKGGDATTDIGRVVERLAANLGVGVPIFFVISGFVLYRPWVAARAAGRAEPGLAAYAWRRFLRIVPAFWVAMVVAVAVFGTWDLLFSATGVASFLFVQIYTADHVGIIGVAWSLDTEVVWYALLPVLATGAGWWASRHRAGEWAPVLALLGGGLALAVALFIAPVPDWWAFTLPFWLAHFAAGMTLAVISVVDWAPARRLAARGGWCVIGAGLVYLVICLSDYLVINDVPHPDWLTGMLDSLLGIPVAVLLLLPAIFDDGRRTGWRRVVGSRPAVYLGLISYGIFLYHGTAFELVADLGIEPWGLQLGTLAGFAVTIAMAAASWHLIERPALSLRRVVGRRDEPTEPAAAGTDHPAVQELAVAERG